MPLRILHIVHGLPRGGLENGVVNIVNHLPSNQFLQAVCCLDKRGEMADRLRPGVEVFELHRQRHDVKLPFRLASLIRKWKPDVSHCRNWNTWLDSVVGHRLAGAPGTLVWSFHGFADGDAFPRRRVYASRILARFSDHLLAVCRDSAERYSARTGVSVNSFDVVYNGVDTSRFSPNSRSASRARLQLPSDSLLVLTVASLTPIKDHIGLVEAIAAVREKLPSTVRFIWVGEGSQRSVVESAISRHGLTDRITLPGNSDQVASYLGASDLFILPSKLEGMSNAILEAMASGLPVIARSVGGNPELVIDGQTGLLCPPGDDASMGDAILRLCGDDALRKAYGIAARQRIDQHFTISAMMKNYADYYSRVARQS